MTESLEFEQVLDVCLDRLRSGESVDACLARYPAHAERLAPLLQLAAGLQPRPGPTMSAAGRRAVETRLLARAATLRARRPAPAPVARKGIGLLRWAGARRLAAALVASALLVCGLLGAGTVSASGSLPGSPLYPIKRASEAMVSSLAPTPQLRARAHLAWAERRLAEVEALLARDASLDEGLLQALDVETELALDAAAQAGREPLEAVAVQAEQQQAVLSALIEEAPDPARPGLERALAASARHSDRARAALEAAGPGPSPAEPGDQPATGSPGSSGSPQPPAAETTPVAPAGAPPGSQDKLPPPADPPGRGVETPPGQDKDNGPGQGQGHGQGQGQDGEHGNGPPDDRGPDGGHGNGPGKDKGGDKDKDKDKDKGKK